MQVTLDDNPNFWPQGPGRWTSPLVLALLAHLLLMAALTWGVHWRKEQTAVAFEAEIWSSLPREAAPRAVAPPPEPEPEPEPKPQPRPEPEPAPPPKPPEPVVKQPEINTELLKKKKEDERKRREAEEQAKKDKQAKLEREKRAKDDAEKKRKAEEERKLAQKKREAQEKADAAERKKDHDNAIARMLGQAGATGGPQARGTAQQSSGPSSGYGGRVIARLRPKIINSSNSPSNMVADVEVRSAPDGTIISRRITRSSGSSAWDQDALRAIDRMAVMPRDEDGSVPSSVIITIKPID